MSFSRGCKNTTANTVVFLLMFHRIVDGEGSLVKVLWAPQDAMVKIHLVQADPRFDSLTMVVQFVGVLPPGFKHGTHVLKLELSQDFNELPDDLFEDGEVPADELSQWEERADA